jgi:hypothetical protein
MRFFVVKCTPQKDKERRLRQGLHYVQKDNKYEILQSLCSLENGGLELSL